jgi:cytochrome c peroxidase
VFCLLRSALGAAAIAAVGCGSSTLAHAPVQPDAADEGAQPDAQTSGDAGSGGAQPDAQTSGDAGSGGASEGGDPDPDPVFTAEQTVAIQALAPDPLPLPPVDRTNRFADDPAAALLGQRLFYDTTLSGPLLDTDNDGSKDTLGTPGQTGRVACSSCHVPASGFSDTRSFQRQISLAAGWGRRRALSLLDVGQARLLMWDGRRDTLYNQVFGPLESVVEMNSSRLYAAEQIFVRYQAAYEAVFGPMPSLDDTSQFPPLSAQLTGCQPQNPGDPQPTCDGTFHGMPGDHAEFDGMTPNNQTAVTGVVANAGKAIGAFERLLACGPSPFDAWVHGSATAMTRAAQRGAAVFVGKGGCVTCHAGPFLSDGQFHNVGLEPQTVQQTFIDSNDPGAFAGIAAAILDPLNSLGNFSDGSDGRLPAVVVPAMLGAFQTPALRCVNMRPTFMHTGQIGTLAGVVAFFNQGGNGSGYPGTSEIHSLGLTALDQSDVVAFMQALDGPGPGPSLQQSP